MESRQQKLINLLRKNQYITPSYSSYGGLSGYQDYGIYGVKLKNKFLQEFRRFFLNNEDIFEIETHAVTPYNVLKASGHVDRFTDFVVYDKNKTCYRADHLAKKYFRENKMLDKLGMVDTWDIKVLEENINSYNMLGEHVSVVNKNLMFEVPGTDIQSDFLRPELAQGIFVNFKAYQQFLQKEVDFGVAQIGQSYRKEISPQSFTRMRCFNQAEIEYFCDPLDKTHVEFDKYKDVNIPILTAEMQINNVTNPSIISIESAVNDGLISHKLMAYFLAKIYLFALKVGLKSDKIRFRQHMKHEMAHYAIQCWDLETFVNNDWLECVGCADRGSFDLENHSKYSFVKNTAQRQLNQHIKYKNTKIIFNKKNIASVYKERSPIIIDYLNSLSNEQLIGFKKDMDLYSKVKFSVSNKDYELDSKMISFEEEELYKTYEEYIPHVIEPSFGIDRLLYSIFEQNFWIRDEDEQRGVLSLPVLLQPYDISVQPLSKNKELSDLTNSIINKLILDGMKVHLDKSSTNIGKRYSRIDEIGIKYVLTVDFDSLKDNMVTIRERDNMIQKRVNISDLYNVLTEILD